MDRQVRWGPPLRDRLHKYMLQVHWGPPLRDRVLATRATNLLQMSLVHQSWLPLNRYLPPRLFLSLSEHLLCQLTWDATTCCGRNPPQLPRDGAQRRPSLRLHQVLLAVYLCFRRTLHSSVRSLRRPHLLSQMRVRPQRLPQRRCR